MILQSRSRTRGGRDVPDPFAELFVIARKTRRRLTENFVLTFLVSVVGIPLAVAGVVASVVAGLLMTVGTVLVLTNSARSLTESLNTD